MDHHKNADIGLYRVSFQLTSRTSRQVVEIEILNYYDDPLKKCMGIYFKNEKLYICVLY